MLYKRIYKALYVNWIIRARENLYFVAFLRTRSPIFNKENHIVVLDPRFREGGEWSTSNLHVCEGLRPIAFPADAGIQSDAISLVSVLVMAIGSTVKKLDNRVIRVINKTFLRYWQKTWLSSDSRNEEKKELVRNLANVVTAAEAIVLFQMNMLPGSFHSYQEALNGIHKWSASLSFLAVSHKIAVATLDSVFKDDVATIGEARDFYE